MSVRHSGHPINNQRDSGGLDSFAVLALIVTFLLRYGPFLKSRWLFGPFLDNVHIYGPIFSEVSRFAPHLFGTRKYVSGVARLSPWTGIASFETALSSALRTTSSACPHCNCECNQERHHRRISPERKWR